MEGRIIPIPIKLIINQVAQTIPGDEGPIEMQKNRKIGVGKQTATKERAKEKNRWLSSTDKRGR